MRLRPLFATLVIASFVLAGVFGLGLMALEPAQHELGCPYSAGHTAMCDAGFSHISHWQAMFLAVLAELMVLFAALACFFAFKVPPKDASHLLAYRWQRAPLRPTLLQELFSQGILHRKEPQLA